MRPVSRALIAGCALGALAASAIGCSSPAPVHLVPVGVAARSYLTSHPVPQRPGMTGGVIVGPSDPWLPIAHCPGHHGRGSIGGPGSCGAWAVRLMTIPGHVVTVSCGSQDQSIPCPGNLVPPESGGEIYVPARLTLTSIDQVTIVRQAAVDVTVDEPGNIQAVGNG